MKEFVLFPKDQVRQGAALRGGARRGGAFPPLICSVESELREKGEARRQTRARPPAPPPPPAGAPAAAGGQVRRRVVRLRPRHQRPGLRAPGAPRPVPPGEGTRGGAVAGTYFPAGPMAECPPPPTPRPRAQARGWYVRLQPGDALFVPKGTFHAVVSLSPSVSYSAFGHTPVELLVTGGAPLQARDALHRAGLWRWGRCTCHAEGAPRPRLAAAVLAAAAAAVIGRCAGGGNPTPPSSLCCCWPALVTRADDTRIVPRLHYRSPTDDGNPPPAVPARLARAPCAQGNHRGRDEKSRGRGGRSGGAVRRSLGGGSEIRNFFGPCSAASRLQQHARRAAKERRLQNIL